MDEPSTQLKLEGPADPFREASLKFRPQAEIVEKALPAMVLDAIASGSLKEAVSVCGHRSYLDKLLEDSGGPTDAIEKQMVEQLAWAHARIGSLHIQSTHAQSTEVATACSSAAAKLMAEHRRTAMALREHRSPIVAKQVTVVKQQNVAAGNQNVALVDNSPGVAQETKSDSELVSNRGLLTHVDSNLPFPAADRRPLEPVEAQGFDPRGSRQATAISHGQSSVDAFNGAENGGGKG